MVEGASAVTDLERTEDNKTLVLEYTKQVLQGPGAATIGRFVAADLVQHSPRIPGGRDGLVAWLGSEASGDYEMLFRLIGQGNLVATLGKRHLGEKDEAVIDLYRIEHGSIVEHWDVAEEILSRDQWGNRGKF